ncbi:hypothetical protein AB6A40_005739 [Gnathostoma spinigerum]|uniref:Nucleoprotein TPR/MPL1 domain-containing protein n=1 Tax=Gnathostoma spinigerum TaxID=75299 RepID=A0ABD6EHH0_9BILA
MSDESQPPPTNFPPLNEVSMDNCENNDKATAVTSVSHGTLFGSSAPSSVPGENLNEVSNTVTGKNQELTGRVGAEQSLIETADVTSCVNSNLDEDMDSLRKSKIQLEHELFVATEQLNSLQAKLSRVTDLAESLKNEKESVEKDRNLRMVAMRQLQEQRDQLMLSKNEFEQKSEILLRAKDDYEARINRLTQEKNLLIANLESTKEEITRLQQRKCCLEVEVDNGFKERRLIAYEKERWEQEKEIYLRSKEWFVKELQERDDKFTTLRIEYARLSGEMAAEKAALMDERDALRDSLDKNKELLKARDQELERMNAKVKEVLDERSKQISKLEEELLSSERLISAYKESAEASELNLRELSNEFSQRGVQLEQSSHGTVLLMLPFFLMK